MVANAITRTHTMDIHALVQATGKPALGYAFYRLQEVLTGRWQQLPVRVLARLFAVSRNTVTDYLDTLAEAGLIRKQLRRRGSKTHLFLALPCQKPGRGASTIGTETTPPAQKLGRGASKSEPVPSQNLGPLNNLSDLNLSDLSDDPDLSPQGAILDRVGVASTHPKYQKMLAMDTEYLQAWADYVAARIQGNPAGYMITAILKGDPVPVEPSQQTGAASASGIDFGPWENGSEGDEPPPPAAVVQEPTGEANPEVDQVQHMLKTHMGTDYIRLFHSATWEIQGGAASVTVRNPQTPPERWRRHLTRWASDALGREVVFRVELAS